MKKYTNINDTGTCNITYIVFTNLSCFVKKSVNVPISAKIDLPNNGTITMNANSKTIQSVNIKAFIILFRYGAFSTSNIVLLASIIAWHPFAEIISPNVSVITELNVIWSVNIGWTNSTTPGGNVSVKKFCIISIGRLNCVRKRILMLALVLKPKRMRMLGCPVVLPILFQKLNYIFLLSFLSLHISFRFFIIASESFIASSIVVCSLVIIA